MTPALLRTLVIQPTLSWLTSIAPIAATRDAEAMMLAIAHQETELNARAQLVRAADGKLVENGPARSWWQMERISVTEVLTNHRTQGWAKTVCRELHVPAEVNEVHRLIAWSDNLGCAFARINLWLDPRALPRAVVEDQEVAWRTYLRAWRPGKPHPERWPVAWRAALAA